MVPTHFTTPPPLSSLFLIRIRSPTSNVCRGDLGLAEFEVVVVVGVVGEVTAVTTSLLVEVLLTVVAVLSLSTSVGKGAEEGATEGVLSVCASVRKRRVEIGRPI